MDQETRAEALAVAGGGEHARALVNRLTGERARDSAIAKGPLRLITVTEEAAAGVNDRWVNLIHETLIRSKGVDAAGKPQAYWPTLWDYIEKHRKRAVWYRRVQEDTQIWRVQEDTQIWIENGRRTFDLWPHERVREAVAALRQVGPERVLSGDEREFLGPIDADAIVAELKRPVTNHRRRALLGMRLDVLGDPRPGVGVDRHRTPQIDWCPVEDGEVEVTGKIPRDRYDPRPPS